MKRIILLLFLTLSFSIACNTDDDVSLDSTEDTLSFVLGEWELTENRIYVSGELDSTSIWACPDIYYFELDPTTSTSYGLMTINEKDDDCEFVDDVYSSQFRAFNNLIRIGSSEFIVSPEGSNTMVWRIYNNLEEEHYRISIFKRI